MSVSTHAPARGATSASAACRDYLTFQLTRPRGARPRVLTACKSEALFQLTRPRGARHFRDRQHAARADVSTHAPARGATTAPWSDVDRCSVSTHAPARGATCAILTTFGRLSRFNSRAREGRDWSAGRVGLFILLFQLTRPRGARRPGRPLQLADRRFNSRAREGRDKRLDAGRSPSDVSTHAPARGATTPPQSDHAVGRVSTHAPARGATWPLGARSGRPPVSTHAPARGATSSEGDFWYKLDVSTHAPARGATRLDEAQKRLENVSTHAPARGATRQGCQGRGRR